MLLKVNIPGVSITAKPRRDGRFQGYASRDGVKHYFYGKTRKEVEEKISKFISEDSAQKIKVQKEKKNSPFFGEYVENWIKLYKEPNLKPTSLFSLRATLRPALEAFGERKIVSITSDEIQNMLLAISAARVREMCLTNLRQLFKKAAMQQIIKRNPCDLVELKKRKAQRRNALTVEEEKLFLKEGSGTEYALLYQVLLATGMRIGEALALTKADVDPAENLVRVTKNVVFVRGKRIAQDTPKSEAGNRELPVPHELVVRMLAQSGDLIFPFSYNAVSHAIRRIAVRTGMTVSVHILRHTYATRLEEAGIPPKIKQYLMGHASLDMTENRYTHAQKAYIGSVSEDVRRLFSKDKNGIDT